MLQTLRRLLHILPASKAQVAFTVALFLFSSCLEVFGIGIVGPFIALANNFDLIEQHPVLAQLQAISGISQPNHFVAVLGVVVIVVFLIKTVVAWGTQVYTIRFSDRQQQLIIAKLTQEYLAAPYIYHTKKNSASIIDRITEIANMFAFSVLMPILTTLSNIIVSIALILLLAVNSISVLLALTVVLLPTFLFLERFKDKVKRWGKQTRTSKEGIIKSVGHAFGGIKETKIIGCEAYFHQQIVNHAQRLEHAHGNFAAFRIFPRFATEGTMVATVLGIMAGSLLLNLGIENLTSVLGVYALAAIRLMPALSNAISGINQLRNTSFTIDQIYLEFAELKSLQVDSVTSRSVPSSNIIQNGSFSNGSAISFASEPQLTFQSEIELAGIQYRYPGSSSLAIDSVSLTIKKGESIAFIGKSGAGKTTLVDIILGLLIPQKGDLLVDGVSIYQNLQAWQKMVGYIPQSIFLIDDTVEKNIAFGVSEEKIDRDRLSEAIRAAQLMEVVENLPHAEKTMVGERGILLSGGQRQRIGIARAIYHEREILILDEATAALDNETERLVTESINALSSDSSKTLITIAHRLSTVENCNHIYLLDQGKVIKSGLFNEVVIM